MKRLIYTILAILAAMPNVQARDRLYLDDFDLTPGTEASLQVKLDNDTAYSALQTDLYLPEGVTVMIEDDEYVIDLTRRKSRSHVLMANKQDDGAIRIVITSLSSQTFSGNSGALFTVTLNVDNTFTNEGTVALRHTVAVEENTTKHKLSDCEVELGVSAPPTGDLNGDNNVNTGDVSALYSVILNGATNDHADLNGDGNVNTGDVSALYAIILGN